MDAILADGHKVTITNPEKILFPQAGYTKKDLCDYYANIAPYLLPLVKNHPVSMHRFVNGINHEEFYQKDADDYFPQWIEKAPMEKKTGGIVNYIMINNAATLIYIANLACITPHMNLYQYNHIDYPDRMVFDLDPAGNADFLLIQWVALKMHSFFELISIKSFIMTTGSRGAHLVIPLQEKENFDQVHLVAKKIAQLFVHFYPEKLTLEARIANRGDKIYIDILRNGHAATAVVPYAVRAHPHAPVATPVSWKEFALKNMSSQKYTIKNIFKRLKNRKDPWKLFKQSSTLVKNISKKIDPLLKELGIIV